MPDITTVLSGQNGDFLVHMSHKYYYGKNYLQHCKILHSENADNECTVLAVE